MDPVEFSEPRTSAPVVSAVKAPPKIDPWAHRRGEPRLFAVLWLTYLMFATMLTVGSAGLLGLVAVDVYRPTARVLFVMATFGVVALWPMTRLCQECPRHPLRAALADTVVLLFSINLMTWPQGLRWMASWTPESVGMLAVFLSAWTLIIGAMLAIALASIARREHESARLRGLATAIPAGPSTQRTLWMAGLMALLILLSALALRTEAGHAADDAAHGRWMWSPLTGVWELTRDESWSGLPTIVLESQRFVVYIVAGVAVIAWVYALAGAATRSRQKQPDIGTGPPE